MPEFIDLEAATNFLFLVTGLIVILTAAYMLFRLSVGKMTKKYVVRFMFKPMPMEEGQLSLANTFRLSIDGQSVFQTILTQELKAPEGDGGGRRRRRRRKDEEEEDDSNKPKAAKWTYIERRLEEGVHDIMVELLDNQVVLSFEKDVFEDVSILCWYEYDKQQIVVQENPYVPFRQKAAA